MFISTSGYAELLLGIPIAFNFNCYRVYIRAQIALCGQCLFVCPLLLLSVCRFDCARVLRFGAHALRYLI